MYCVLQLNSSHIYEIFEYVKGVKQSVTFYWFKHAMEETEIAGKKTYFSCSELA